MADDLTLTANNRAISGWEEISVRLSAETMPSSFEIALSALDPGTGLDVIVRPGDPCQIALGGDTVITGYVDSVTNSGSAEGHVIRVAGRGKCQDLVDCSAEWDGGQIRDGTALDIATKLASPYKIAVALVNGAQAGPQVPQLALTYGETAADIIQRVARNAGQLAYEATDGSLALAAVGSKVAASGAIYGENVETWSVELSANLRYQEIWCTLQAQDMLSDVGDAGFFFDKETDPNVTRHRRLYMPLEQAATGAQPFTALKAKWEMARRAGRSVSVAVTIDSWRDGSGALWLPNSLVPVSLPGLSADYSTLCISDVTFRRDQSGTHADLMLLPPAAFSPEPISLQPINLNDITSGDGS